jgi:hypothetical protein
MRCPVGSIAGNRSCAQPEMPSDKIASDTAVHLANSERDTSLVPFILVSRGGIGACRSPATNQRSSEP